MISALSFISINRSVIEKPLRLLSKLYHRYNVYFSVICLTLIIVVIIIISIIILLEEVNVGR